MLKPMREGVPAHLNCASEIPTTGVGHACRLVCAHTPHSWVSCVCHVQSNTFASRARVPCTNFQTACLANARVELFFNTGWTSRAFADPIHRARPPTYALLLGRDPLRQKINVLGPSSLASQIALKAHFSSSSIYWTNRNRGPLGQLCLRLSINSLKWSKLLWTRSSCLDGLGFTSRI